MTETTAAAQPQIINREFEERQAKQLAERFGVEYINISAKPINPDVIKVIPSETALGLKVIPFHKNHKSIKVALVFPNSEPVQNYIKQLKEEYEVEVAICSQTGYNEASAVYESQIVKKKTVETRQEYDEKSEGGALNNEKFKQIEAKLPSMQTEVALNEIILLGLQAHTSDIHLQPYLDRMKLRFRVNGILRDILEVDLQVAARIVSRIKYDSGTKSNVSDIPQDGRMSISANDRSIDIRVSIIPTETVESVTMRILDVRKGLKKFDELGFRPEQVQAIKDVIYEPSGMILMTGPTGSGKTTTLYAMLSELNTPERKIVTLEDPIEYHLPNVTQSQVDSKKEYNFASGLKALLRHDPDIILIGEIRDFDTARLALEAAQTGHLVFSSLHSNSSLGAVSRLRNFGIDNFNIASAANAIFAQRLVRTLCPHCRKKVKAKYPPQLQLLADKYSINLSESVYESVGCEECGHTGFIGRTTITEVLFMDQFLAGLVTENKPEHKIKETLVKEKSFKTLLIDGLEKVSAGDTSLEELLRIVSIREEE